MSMPEILEIPVEMIVLEFDTDTWVLEIPPSEKPSVLIAYLPPTPQNVSAGSGSTIIGQALTITNDGQTVFNYAGFILNPAATWLEIDHSIYRYSVDYMLDTGLSILTWLGDFKLEISDQITLYA